MVMGKSEDEAVVKETQPSQNGTNLVNLVNGFSTVSVNGTIQTNNTPTTSVDLGGIVEFQIPVPWGHIAGKAHGNPCGKPVLAVHGWMDNAGSFDKLIPLLSKSLYIVAIDLPGHGLSSHIPPGIPYHFTDYIICLRRVANHFKWSKFSWLGHSMGAGLGALYASSFPTYVEHLIMIDLVKPLTGQTNSDYASQISTAVDQFIALEEKIQPDPPTYTYDVAVERLIKGAGHGGKLSTEAAQLLMIRGAKNVGDDKWCFTRDIRLRSPSALRFSNEQCFGILEKMRANTLILKASEGPWYEPKESCDRAIEIYRKNCPVFQYEVVEGNHFVHLVDPEKCSGLINQFLLEPRSNL